MWFDLLKDFKFLPNAKTPAGWWSKVDGPNVNLSHYGKKMKRFMEQGMSEEESLEQVTKEIMTTLTHESIHDAMSGDRMKKLETIAEIITNINNDMKIQLHLGMPPEEPNFDKLLDLVLAYCNYEMLEEYFAGIAQGVPSKARLLVSRYQLDITNQLKLVFIDGLKEYLKGALPKYVELGMDEDMVDSVDTMTIRLTTHLVEQAKIRLTNVMKAMTESELRKVRADVMRGDMRSLMNDSYIKIIMELMNLGDGKTNVLDGYLAGREVEDIMREIYGEDLI